MSKTDNIVDFQQTSSKKDPFLTARRRVEQCLIQNTLLDSYKRFLDAGIAYPFIEPDRVFPEQDHRASEMHLQNTALVFLLDCPMPRSLNKYFRLRSSNKVSWRNLRRLLPEESHEEFKSAHCRLDSSKFPELLQRLLPSDYALLVEQEGDDTVPVLSHMHVKVERLTDIALREVGKQLGYIDRALFERGEDYVEELEAKFFEYHGFSANASGRKSAAAIAAQLFGKSVPRFSVFVTSQTDNRLTHLCEEDSFTQHFLARLDLSAQEQLSAQCKEFELTSLLPYAVDQFIDGALTVQMRIRYGRTSAAKPAENRSKVKDLSRSWIKIEDQSIIPLDTTLPELRIDWAHLSDKS